MKTIYLIIIGLVVTSLMLLGCGPSKEELAGQIASAAEATVKAMPSQTPLPTQTPLYADPSDLLCINNFCIGHPGDSILTVGGVDGTKLARYRDGYIEWVSGGKDKSVVIAVGWIMSTKDEWDVTETITYLMDDVNGVPQGPEAEIVVDAASVTYRIYEVNSINMTGIAAAWHCGDRGFWMQLHGEDSALIMSVLEQAVERFACVQ